jgi:hypothetical protein
VCLPIFRQETPGIVALPKSPLPKNQPKISRLLRCFLFICRPTKAKKNPVWLRPDWLDYFYSDENIRNMANKVEVASWLY